MALALQALHPGACGSVPGGREAAPRLHLTLHFLGNVPRSHLSGLRCALCVPFAPFDLQFDRCLRWPQGLVVARPASPPAALAALHAALAGALKSLDLRSDERAFSPHITLARRHLGAWTGQDTPSMPLHWNVREYVLAESVHGPPASYRVLQTCTAKAGG